ncbi:MAG: gliding motility-associated C-terminal domain-containing protein, partial [Bacteroidales bacterium]|nr:gliding motility-associated C-terminal domain-containing protein [Bacteroidales bacterium]
SEYGNLSFPDTTYKCANDTITLDGGYAQSYYWTLPDGSHPVTPTVSAFDTGLYTVTVFQFPDTITASTLVLNRFEGASVFVSDVNGGDLTYSVNLAGQSGVNVTYEWKEGNVILSTADTLKLLWSSAGERIITLTLTDTILNCTKIIIFSHKQPKITAVDDYITVLKNSSGTPIAVAINDTIPCVNPLTDTITGGGPKHGALLITNDALFIYTPQTNYVGCDTITYFIYCSDSSDADTAVVYILVHQPLSLQYAACPNAVVTMGFTPISGLSYNWYNAQIGGNIVNSGTNTDTLTVTKDASSEQTWWVEPVYGGKVFDRYRVSLTLGICGDTNPTGCAATGTLLFKEDFGGNDPNDPTHSATPLPQGSTTYTFLPSSYNIYDGYYSLSKVSEASIHPWYLYEDHTIAGSDRGYFMVVGANENPDMFYTTTFNGLCENLKLYFSVWVGNLINDPSSVYIKPKLRFVLQDAVTLVTLAEYSTSDIAVESQAMWKQYGFEFTVIGSYSVKLSIYNDAQGVTGNDLVLDDIEIRFCVPEVNIAIDSILTCEYSEVTLSGSFTDENTFGNNLVSHWEYSSSGDMNDPTAWSIVQGSSNSSANGTVVNDYTLFNISRLQTGYYRMIAGNSANINSYYCRAMSRTVYVEVDTLSIINVTMADSMILCNSPITLTVYSPNGDYFLWNTGETTETILVSTPGIYWVKVSNAVCNARDTTVVIQEKVPEFQIRSKGDLCIDEPMELSVSVAVENVRYRWSTEDTSVRISISSEGTYSVSVLFENGCEASRSIEIVCPCYLWLPNIFTPNGDNINDVFLPVLSSEVHTFHMYIYDRWGNLIFKTDMLTSWDGTVNGEVATTGVYYGVVFYSCKDNPSVMQTVQSSITLVR